MTANLRPALVAAVRQALSLGILRAVSVEEWIADTVATTIRNEKQDKAGLARANRHLTAEQTRRQKGGK